MNSKTLKIIEPSTDKYSLICVRCKKKIDTSKMSCEEYFKLIFTRKQQRLHETCKIKLI